MPPVGPPPPTDPACDRPDLARRLVEWDTLASRELAALEAHAAACPQCAQELAMLRRADRWLRSRATGKPAGSCPSSEALYDFGKGPGARVLEPEERLELERHVARCAECAELVATLASRPPAPLVLEPEPGPARTRRAPTRSRLRLVVGLAAAAGVAAALGTWVLRGRPADVGTVVAAGPRFPEAPLLRGDLGGPLLFPRGRVLARPDGTLVHGLAFELEPQERASSYRLTLLRRDAGAPGREQPVLSLESAAPRLEARATELEPGLYTWEAWATLDGLDVPLGRRDFEVSADERTLADLAALEREGEPARSERALTLLVERGYVSDARAWAATLPPSAQRDAFLARPPGR